MEGRRKVTGIFRGWKRRPDARVRSGGPAPPGRLRVVHQTALPEARALAAQGKRRRSGGAVCVAAPPGVALCTLWIAGRPPRTTQSSQGSALCPVIKGFEDGKTSGAAHAVECGPLASSLNVLESSRLVQSTGAPQPSALRACPCRKRPPASAAPAHPFHDIRQTVGACTHGAAGAAGDREDSARALAAASRVARPAHPIPIITYNFHS